MQLKRENASSVCFSFYVFVYSGIIPWTSCSAQWPPNKFMGFESKMYKNIFKYHLHNKIVYRLFFILNFTILNEVNHLNNSMLSAVSGMLDTSH